MAEKRELPVDVLCIRTLVVIFTTNGGQLTAEWPPLVEQVNRW